MDKINHHPVLGFGINSNKREQKLMKGKSLAMVAMALVATAALSAVQFTSASYADIADNELSIKAENSASDQDITIKKKSAGTIGTNGGSAFEEVNNPS